jgi:DNA replication protein DnaC
MLIQQTIEGMHSLRLNAMAQAFEQQRGNPALQELPFEDRLGMLVEHERQARDCRRVDRLLKTARLKANDASVEDIDFRASRGLDKRQVTSLMNCDWVQKGQNLILTGPTGVGKTWLACAYANQAARRGLPVLYRRLPRLLEEMEIAREDGSLLKLRQQLAKTRLLVLDDWGVCTLTSQGRQDLLEIVDDRVGVLSTAITSQLPISDWHTYLGEPTIADAILDRLVHSAHRIALKGESMRKLKADSNRTGAQ